MNNNFKTTIIGASTTGKTTLVRRMVHNVFSFRSECTIGVSFSKYTHNDINYQVWDTAGQERFSSLLPMYFRSTKIFIFVFDVTALDTVQDYDKYQDNLNIADDYKIIVVGNKIDLLDDDRLKMEDRIEIIDRGLKSKFKNITVSDFVFVSAKTGEGMDKLVDALHKCGLELYNASNSDTKKSVNVKLDTDYIKDGCYC